MVIGQCPARTADHVAIGVIGVCITARLGDCVRLYAIGVIANLRVIGHVANRIVIVRDWAIGPLGLGKPVEIVIGEGLVSAAVQVVCDGSDIA
jgi:hypothetical protein